MCIIEYDFIIHANTSKVPSDHTQCNCAQMPHTRCMTFAVDAKRRWSNGGNERLFSLSLNRVVSTIQVHMQLNCNNHATMSARHSSFRNLQPGVWDCKHFSLVHYHSYISIDLYVRFDIALLRSCLNSNVNMCYSVGTTTSQLACLFQVDKRTVTTRRLLLTDEQSVCMTVTTLYNIKSRHLIYQGHFYSSSCTPTRSLLHV